MDDAGLFTSHVASFLKSARYYTALIGLQHVARDAVLIGYDYTDTTSEYENGGTFSITP